MQVSSLLSTDGDVTPRAKTLAAKSVSFELLLDEGSKTRARIPLRVVLNTHDTTESIITTVKNFYGIYDGHGVSFEDAMGNTLIASYDNLVHNATVYVRIVPAPQAASNVIPHAFNAENGYDSRRRPSLGEPFSMLPPHLREQSQSPSRPASRVARKRSTSPTQGRGRRSASQHKSTSYGAVSRGSSANGSLHEDNGYSDSEAGRSSISGSKKAKSEQFASSDISTANVLQDGRRGQPIFDSSVPVTASQSSISPQRRSLPQEGPSPLHPPGQKLYGYGHVPVLSPQSYGPPFSGFSYGDRGVVADVATPSQQHGHRLRDRASMQQGHGGRQGYVGNGVLPTPDPTVASCISDEDVARTLIALGDASNYSHGRTSNSTMDETFSAAADAASSTGATSDSDEYSDVEANPPKHRSQLEEEDDDYAHGTNGDQDDYDGPPKTKKIKTKMHDGPTHGFKPKSTSSMKTGKPSKPRTNSLPKPLKSVQPGLMKAPSVPASAGQVRKSSGSSLNFQHPLGTDEEDLSSKPRCQRCRKSKKGCDRQRPCGRCKDAGIGIDGCVSEDEGNGRKGRYGRHMGVAVQKKPGEGSVTDEPYVAMADFDMSSEAIDYQGSLEKNKKRKR
ncbi:hypothetical protein H2200_003413 [Cladophialophora chaetospira]|uniref:Zn(2)-C6 fungal-type domain-containing protein n=1 Tax=Cladophialophora chaetospira TaxID=386627 RepID=A0AA38XI06_9EURO|nr:hypothetical protein H2200_003413 [Cladophialophora chaetospira]